MREFRVLVTAVGGDLAQSVIKCLRDSAYVSYIVGCDIDPYASGRGMVHTFLQAPPVKDEKQYLDFIADTVRRERIDVVFPLFEAEMFFLSQRLEQLEGCGARFIINEARVLDIFSDKYRTAEYFKSNGFLSPATYLPGGYNGELGFPLILKRRRGSGSRRLFKITDQEELDFYLGRNNDMVIQEYIPGDEAEYTSGIFSDGKQVFTITFKRSLAPGGFSQRAELVSDQAIESFPRKVGEVLRFKGSVNVQFRVTPEGCVPFEINPRFSSTVYIRHRFGFKDVCWSLDMLAGKSVAYRPLYKQGIGIRNFGEVFFDMEKE